MSWTFLAVAVNSAEPSLRLCLNPAGCQQGPLSIANAPNIPERCCCPGCSEVRSMPLPSMTTLQNYKLGGTLASEPSSAAGPARAIASQALEKAWRTSEAVLLSKSSGLFAIYDPSSSSWKTCQVSLLPQEMESDSSPTRWPNSAMSSGGRTWQLPTLGKRIRDSGSGFWLTPRAMEPQESPEAFSKRMGDRGLDNHGSLSGEVKTWSLWPTTSAASADGGQIRKKAGLKGKMPDGSKAQVSMGMAAKIWATARTSDANGSGLHGDGGMDLRTQAWSWATPTASAGDKNGGSHRGREDTIDSQTKLWATTTRDFRSGKGHGL